MEVLLDDYTQDPEMRIARYSARCYDADTSEEANSRRIVKLLNYGHLATLRFAYATFDIRGISRITSHQLVRAKHLDYLQRSQRYVDEHGIEFIVPPSIESNEGALAVYDAAVRYSSDVYKQLRAMGIKKEDARYALAHSGTTEMWVTGNFQAWYDFLNNRLVDKAAQWEIKEIARRVHEHLVSIAPNIFGGLSQC